MKILHSTHSLFWLILFMSMGIVGCQQESRKGKVVAPQFKKVFTSQAKRNQWLTEQQREYAKVENRQKQILKETLKIDEGLRLNPYFCSEGYATVGWGRNFESNPITDEERELGKKYGFRSSEFLGKLLENDMQRAIEEMEREFPWVKQMEPVRQRGIVNMIFQMGLGGFRKFERSLAALELEDYERAELYLTQSKWYRQTPERAARVIRQITRGLEPYPQLVSRDAGEQRNT